jgi:uncharacterized protein YceK
MRKIIIALTAAATLAGCSSNSSSTPTTSGPAPSTTVSPSVSTPPAPPWAQALAQKTYAPKIVASQFTDQITNPYMPFKQGSTYIYQGTRDGVPLRIEVSVQTTTKVILGVKCMVVSDIVTGALEERTTDWYAQDKAGNLWYFGEDTKEYVNGVVTSTAGSWEAGVNGALPGIVMPAKPVAGTAYREEYRPTQAEDVAKIIKVNASVHLPVGNYQHVVVTENRDLLDLTKHEHKYYAPGVGMVQLNGVVNGHVEVVQLTSILTAK